MRNIFNKVKPAFGYLQVFRGKLPAHTPGDIESGRLNIRQNRSTHLTVKHAPNPPSSGSLEFNPKDHVNHPALSPSPNDDHIEYGDISQQQSTDLMVEDAPQAQSTRSLEANQEDLVNLPAMNSNPDDDRMEHEQPLRSSFTEGPSRFVLAKDGSRDCVALLVNETFLAKLQDLFNETRDLRMLDGPLYHARKGTSNVERSIQRAQESLETVEGEERADECRKTLEQNGPELLQKRQWRDELEKEYELVKSNHELSTNHTQWVLETAMREANLLGPEKPLPAILARQEEVDPTEHENEVSEDEIEVSEYTMTPQSPVASVTSDHSELPVSPEVLERQAAWNHFVQRDQALEAVQAKFDNQKQNYQDNLAKYQQKLEAGATSMSRSAFDRRSVQYGQQLTRALIDAEEAFEEARERAQDLGAIGSDYGQEFYYGAEYEESWPENKIADYNASCDWGFVRDWMENVPDSTSQVDMESVEIDEWDAKEVDVNDSISMIDCEDYRREIDRYQRQCAHLGDPCPEVRLLGQPDARPLERRRSCWM